MQNNKPNLFPPGRAGATPLPSPSSTRPRTRHGQLCAIVDRSGYGLGVVKTGPSAKSDRARPISATKLHSVVEWPERRVTHYTHGVSNYDYLILTILGAENAQNAPNTIM